jgi:hypothetical protein
LPFTFLLLTFVISTHAVFDVVVDDEVELFVGEAVVVSEEAIDLINNGFC